MPMRWRRSGASRRRTAAPWSSPARTGTRAWWASWPPASARIRLSQLHDPPEGRRGKGSCRSYGGFNLFAALESCADLLEGFGGHELAAGFTISQENIDAFRARKNRYVRSASGGEPAVSSLDVDAAIACPGEVTLAEAEQLEQLEPYGAGNPGPCSPCWAPRWTPSSP